MVVTLAVSAVAEGSVAWVAAVWFGAAVGFSFYAIDAVPNHIENWGIGAAGERKTEKVLRPLQRVGWHFVTTWTALAPAVSTT